MNSTQALKILAEPTVIQGLKDLRFKGAERKMKKFNKERIRIKLELLKLPDYSCSCLVKKNLMLLKPLYVPPLTVPTVIYERDFERFIFKYDTTSTN